MTKVAQQAKTYNGA